jgi:exodeoxyribonuclease VII small subunit
MKLTYTQAIGELEEIVVALENAKETNIDHLNAKVKRAAELLAFCKKQLHDTDAELEKMLEQIDN